MKEPLKVTYFGKILEMSYRDKAMTVLVDDIDEALVKVKKFYEELHD